MSNPKKCSPGIGAIILGAGLSSRMGTPKLLLPWGSRTVIATIIHTLQVAGVDEIVLVTGASHDQLSQALRDEQIKFAFNPDFADGNMATSLKTGLRQLEQDGMDSALLALGDQPQIQVDVVRQVLAAGQAGSGRLILPSHLMKRGHPWLIPSALWPAIFSLQPDQTMRDFVRSQEAAIEYVTVDTPTIFADLDTPADYERDRPR